MSKARSEMKNALRALDVSKPLRIPQSLGFAAPKQTPAPEALAAVSSRDKGESGSNFDPVSMAPKGFTRVPNALLRMDQPFSEPVDFMIYLHLFTYSYGFGRETASRSQAQLERYTGAVRNTVRKSIERLTHQGWIECVEEYEASRMSRKWKVRAIGESHLTEPSPTTGSNSDPVKNSPGQNLTRTGSKNDPVTGSKFDPYKESSNKENSKNSLSRVHAGASASVRETAAGSPESGEGLVGGIGNETLREYFAQASMTPRKRHSELQAYHELRHGFEDAQIAACVEYLSRKGLPGSGEHCRSPMAFLSKAMGQVLGLVHAEATKRDEAQARVERKRLAHESRLQAEVDEIQAERTREESFEKAFPTAEDQARAVARYGADFRMFARSPILLRKLAIGVWAGAQNEG